MENMKDARLNSGSRQRPGSGRDRPESASRARTDSITTIEVCVLVSGPSLLFCCA